MRTRHSAVLLCLVGLLAACTSQDSSNDDRTPSTAPSPESVLQSVVITPTMVQPPRTGSLPAPVVPVGTYMVAWQNGLRGKAVFDAEVGVAALDEGDKISNYCVDPNAKFDVNGSVVLYCRTAHKGPDALPQPGMILVPYRAYTRVVQTSGLDRTAIDQGTAVLMAAGYAQHVVAELQSNGVPQAETLKQRINCMTGLTLHSYIYAIEDVQWDKAWKFLENFSVAAAPAWNLSEIKSGYRSGRLKTCLS